MAEIPSAEKSSSSLREMVAKGRPLWWTAGFLVLAALVIAILWKVPQLQVEHAGIAPENRFNSENEARKTLATMLGAVVVLGGAYFTWRNIKLVQEGQITDRFTKAIEQLGAVDASGKKKMEVRLGGIYALERIANQSERDHWPIVEVLSAYVRENAPRKSQGSTQENQASGEPSHLALDIQAILTVLGRRDQNTKINVLISRRQIFTGRASAERPSPGRTSAERTSRGRTSTRPTSAGRSSGTRILGRRTSGGRTS